MQCVFLSLKKNFPVCARVAKPRNFLLQGYITSGIFFGALASETKIFNEFFRNKRTLWSLRNMLQAHLFHHLNMCSGKLGSTTSLHSSRKTTLLWMLGKTLWHILSPLIRDPGQGIHTTDRNKPSKHHFLQTEVSLFWPGAEPSATQWSPARVEPVGTAAPGGLNPPDDSRSWGFCIYTEAAESI